jgi:hypothetical protein
MCGWRSPAMRSWGCGPGRACVRPVRGQSHAVASIRRDTSWTPSMAFDSPGSTITPPPHLDQRGSSTPSRTERPRPWRTNRRSRARSPMLPRRTPQPRWQLRARADPDPTSEFLVVARIPQRRTFVASISLVTRGAPGSPRFVCAANGTALAGGLVRFVALWVHSTRRPKHTRSGRWSRPGYRACSAPALPAPSWGRGRRRSSHL